MICVVLTSSAVCCDVKGIGLWRSVPGGHPGRIIIDASAPATNIAGEP